MDDALEDPNVHCGEETQVGHSSGDCYRVHVENGDLQLEPFVMDALYEVEGGL